MMRSLFFVALIMSGNTFAKMAQNASADMAVASRGLEAEPPTYSIPHAKVHEYYQNLKKTRALNADETAIHNIATVGSTLKVENITSHSQDVALTQLTSMTNALVAKIKENPKWDVSLSASEIQAITPHLEQLKASLSEKSYGWAWFLKQTGKTAEAKQVLTTLFNERCAGAMKKTETYNRHNPLSDVIEVEQALLPLSNEAEKTKIQKKMQDVKVHVSNLKDYSIMT